MRYVYTVKIVTEIDENLAGMYTPRLIGDIVGLDTRDCPGFAVIHTAVTKAAEVPVVHHEICPQCFGNLDRPYLIPVGGNCHGAFIEFTDSELVKGGN